MMQKLEKEKIFPPKFFNLMQHLLIHLPYKAKVGGTVQYRWMYHIERCLRYLKPIVGNRARLEGCITEAFTFKEVAYFSSVYIAEEVAYIKPMVDNRDACCDAKTETNKERSSVA
jgi:hypothetical protein